MNRPADRPAQPFLTKDGVARLRTALSPAGPVDYRPGQVIIDLREFDGGVDSVDRTIARISTSIGVELRTDKTDLSQTKRSGLLRAHFTTDDDTRVVIERIRREFGHRAASTNAVFTIGSVTADPMHFTSTLTADPMHFTAGYSADPMHFTNSSTARPVVRPTSWDTYPRATKGPGQATVAILDTGAPPVGPAGPSDIDFVGPTGTIRERADINGDDFLDIAAGHTTFIRTIIHRASPAAVVLVEGVIHNDGDGDEADIANALARVVDSVRDPSRLIVNLSFSGYYDDDVEPPMIGFWIRELVTAGAVVVAAAGNDGACRKKYPAAMPEVIAVSSVGPCGPSPFSNHGPWVDATAPGEDLISEFFANFDGAYEPLVPGSVPDIDDFSGWAMWSGTSFSTPAVVGALAEIVETHDCPAVDAVRILLRRPGLLRVPDYGVVVNRVF
ncbi:MAG: S8 family serine peptidase [Ilumatobacteraceae bacterium]